MKSLFELLNIHGKPQALIDDWNETSIPKAIWGHEEIFMINSNGKVILNDEIISGDPFQLFQKTLDRWKATSNDLAAVGYISYDLKNLLYPHLNFKPNIHGEPLLWFAKPKITLPYEIKKYEKKFDPLKISIEKNIPNQIDYEKSIKKIKCFLAKGDTYQINFTQPKEYQIDGNPFDIYLSMREKIQPNCGMYLNSGKMNILSFNYEIVKKIVQNIS